MSTLQQALAPLASHKARSCAGKRGFPTREDAISWGRTKGAGWKVSAYKCLCGSYHLSKKLFFEEPVSIS